MRTDPQPPQLWLEKISPKPELIVWIEQRLKAADRLGINIGLEEGLLLKTLCSQPHVEKVVEIGTQYGCSASWMALGLGQKGTIYTFEKDPVCFKEAEITFSDPRFQSFGCEVQIFLGDAQEKLTEIEKQSPFDLIFIDANKSAYSSYVKWAKKHIAIGGLIIVDNIYLWGTQFLEQCPENTSEKMWKRVRESIDDLVNDSHYSTSIVPTAEGLLISCKKN